MRKLGALLIIILAVGMAISSGCIGGGGGTTTPSSTAESVTTTPATSSSSIETSTSSPVSTTTTETTSTSTSAQTTTTTTTTTPTEELYWKNPWEYAPVIINGNEYKVVYYKIHYKVQPNQSSPTYEYIVEKSVRKTKIHVYGMDYSGSKVDLGEKDVYEYTTVVTPKKTAQLKDKLTIKVWYTKEKGDSFIYPWDMGWLGSMGSYGSSGGDFVGFQFEYRGDKFTFTNPGPFQAGLLPYMDGDTEWMDKVGEDLTNLYMGWFAVVQLGIWTSWTDKNLAVPQSGVWSDGVHSWEWSTTPDGTATFSGVKLKLVKAQWKYEGSAEGVSMSGKATFSPSLFLPLEVEGYFSYASSETGKTTNVYGYIKVEDLKLEKTG